MASLPQNLLQLRKGMKAFGARSLFTDASFSVNEGERIGVIGPNGAGKSTLFRVLVGQEILDSGEITRASGLRIGYLAQDDRWTGDETVEEYLVSQTVTPIWELKQMAPRFGLSLDHFEKKITSLSGGYRMRVKLLHLLASRPDLMLLDEPTNYLDLETLLVLENFLQNAGSAFMLISHDREFLRRTTDHILEIEAGEMTKFAGNIDDYFEQKELLRQQLLRTALNVEAKKNQILEFAARFGAKATKARQAQSRLKQLDRMESIEVRRLPTKAKIRLPEPLRTGRMVIQFHEAAFGYGEKTVLSGLNLQLQQGDHLGVVGLNGAGKSTLLKALASELKPLTGQIEVGLNVNIAYYAQHVAERLNPEDTVFEAMIGEAAPETRQQEVLDLAGSLLFGGDDVHKKVRVLSGGEKSRVALGRILLKRSTCLLLDEPTNHLDFDTVEALTQALQAYVGTVVIVSHDRGFVSRTATKILEIRDGRAEQYPGTYDEYVWSVQKGALSEREAVIASSASLPQKEPARGNPEVKFNFKEWKKLLEKEQRSLEKETTLLDQKNVAMKEQILKLNEELASLRGSAAADQARVIAELQANVDQVEERFLECLLRIDEIQKDLSSIEKA